MGFTLAFFRKDRYNYILSLTTNDEVLAELGADGDYIVIDNFNGYPVYSNGIYILIYLTEYTNVETGETYGPGYQMFEQPNTYEVEGELADE